MGCDKLRFFAFNKGLSNAVGATVSVKSPISAGELKTLAYPVRCIPDAAAPQEARAAALFSRLAAIGLALPAFAASRLFNDCAQGNEGFSMAHCNVNGINDAHLHCALAEFGVGIDH